MKALIGAVLLALASMLATGGAVSAATAPDWLVAAMSTPDRVYPADPDPVSACVLMDEAVLDVSSDGTFTRRLRWVVRILTSGGRDQAVARVAYDTDSSKVKSFTAWVVRKPGDVRVLGKKDTVDIASYSSALELYGEARVMVIAGGDAVDVGSVFAYEAIVQERSLFAQELWAFQSGLPVERSSITVMAPPGWTVAGRMFGHVPLESRPLRGGQTWELTQLPALRTEPYAPRTKIGARLAIDLRPPAGEKNQVRRFFDSWGAISAYFTPRYEQAAALEPALVAKAAQLTAGQNTTWEKIRALCGFVQTTNYISINLNTASAGGMIPRPASRVLACNYGDCKDKTTLLRALLAAQGIHSYALIANSGNPTSVEPSWPSVWQFNHCVIAIEVDDSIDNPAVLHHPTFGRLLIFDPTNPYTPAGVVAEEVQGGRALLLAGERGELIEPPLIPPSENIERRELRVTLEANGAIKGRLVEQTAGNAAAEERALWRTLATTPFQERIERWIARTVPGVRIAGLTVDDDFSTGRHTTTVDFSAGVYARRMQGQLLVFRPVLVERRRALPLKAEKRTQPIVVPSGGFDETAIFALPAGYKIDELPGPLVIETPFGRYEAASKAEDGGRTVSFARKLILRSSTLPPTEYEAVRAFFDKVLRYEQSPIVLARD